MEDLLIESWGWCPVYRVPELRLVVQKASSPGIEGVIQFWEQARVLKEELEVLQCIFVFFFLLLVELQFLQKRRRNRRVPELVPWTAWLRGSAEHCAAAGHWDD